MRKQMLKNFAVAACTIVDSIINVLILDMASMATGPRVTLQSCQPSKYYYNIISDRAFNIILAR